MFIGIGASLTSERGRGGGTPVNVLTDATLHLDFTSDTFEVGATSDARSADTLANMPGYSFARNLEAIYTDADGVLSTFGANEPRVGNRGYLVERASTNLLLHSNDLDNDSGTDGWVTRFSGSSVSQNQTGPDGVANSAFGLSNGVSNDGQRVFNDNDNRPSLTASNTYAYSMYAKAISGDDRWLQVLCTTNANAERAGMTVDLSDGTITEESFVTHTKVATRVEALTDGWYRLQIIFTAAGTAGACTVEITMSDTPTPGGDVNYEFGGGGSVIGLAYVQLEAGAQVTSPIATAGTQVTRPADTLLLDTSTAWYTNEEGSWYLEFESPFGDERSGSTETLFMMDDGSDNNDRHHFLKAGGSDALIYAMASGGNQPNTGGSNEIQAGINKVAGAYGGRLFAQAVNDGETRTTVGSNLATVPDSLGVGVNSFNTSLHYTGYIRQLTYFDVKKTNAQLEVLAGGAAKPATIPSDLASLWSWHDASDTSEITNISDQASIFADKSGNGYDFTQTTPSLRPATDTRSINGLNVLDFTSAQRMNATFGTDRFDIESYSAYGLFAVFQLDSTSGTDIVYEIFFEAPPDLRFPVGVDDTAPDTWNVSARRAPTNNITDISDPNGVTRLVVLSIRGNGVNERFDLYANNVYLGRNDYSAVSGLTLTEGFRDILLGNDLTLGRAADMAFCEMVVATDVSVAEFSALNQSLMAKWGIS